MLQNLSLHPMYVVEPRNQVSRNPKYHVQEFFYYLNLAMFCSDHVTEFIFTSHDHERHITSQEHE